jgi:N-acetylmuramoyl-L-alanine amidase
VRASPGASLRIILQDGSVVPLFVDSTPASIPWGIRAFGRDTAKLRGPIDGTRYVGVIGARTIGSPAGPVIDIGAQSIDGSPCPRAQDMSCRGGLEVQPAMVEAVRGSDTTRAAWPLQIASLDGPPLVVELDDDPAGDGDTDGLTVGRAAPGATFHWFLPRGTRAVVSGRVNGTLRLQLSKDAVAWVPADEATALPDGVSFPSARVGFLTLTPSTDRVTVRIPMGRRVPFRIDEGGTAIRLRLYSAFADAGWIRYGGTDDFVDRVDWLQDRSDEVVLSFELSQPVWGYRTRWDGNDLLLEIRRPPSIDPDRPLNNRYIMIDPGHPPGGAKGPTGLREAEANLAVSLRIQTLLEQAGARVVMSRVSDSAVGLLARVRRADSLDVELLVSVHNNALPDGVNPFVAHGSSVYYFHPQSVPLAREIQRALVRQLRLRNLGVSRGNLALTRPTWMPAVLTEGLFIMMPEQEAALRSEVGQQLYALAVVEGIEAFLLERALTQD